MGAIVLVAFGLVTTRLTRPTKSADLREPDVGYIWADRARHVDDDIMGIGIGKHLSDTGASR